MGVVPLVCYLPVRREKGLIMGDRHRLVTYAGVLAASAAALVLPGWLVVAGAVGVLVATSRKAAMPNSLVLIARVALALALLPLWVLMAGLLVRLGSRRRRGGAKE